MKSLIWLAIIGLAHVALGAEDILLEADNSTATFFCRRPPQKNDPLTIAFPKTFTVSIDAVYYTNETQPRISDVIQSVDQTNGLYAIVRYEDGIRYQYIFNQTAKTYAFINASTTCVEKPLPFLTPGDNQTDPILFPSNATAKWWNNVTSILDVWTWATQVGKEIYKDSNPNHGSEHGIPVDHYYVCKPGANPNEVFEIEICVTTPDSKSTYAGFNGSLPLRIDIKRFNNDSKLTTLTVEEFVGYRLSAYRPVIAQELPFLPPAGMPCENVSAQARPAVPNLPTKFTVQSKYVDHNDHRIDINQLSVDQEAHYVAFDYTYNDTTAPMAAHALLPKGKYRIVHDFNYGLEYIVDMAGDKCVSVSAIPGEAADIYLDQTGKSIVMAIKNSSDILGVDFENATFYYVGERFLDNIVPSDVWLAYKRINETAGKESRTRTVVHEAYFSKPGWKFYNGGAVVTTPALLALKVYEHADTDVAGAPQLISTQIFHEFVEYAKQSVPITFFDVTPCLNVSKNDSFLVVVANGTLENILKNGRQPVENALRLAISQAAGISPLRVTNFYFETANNTLWIFFFIGEQYNITAAHTKWLSESISAKQAVANLNKTLSSKAIQVTVPLEEGGKFDIILQQNSLTAVPPYFSPPTIHTVVSGGGYSGGSMAALGICMILIGGVLGMVLAFFMWKRNRESSGASVYFSNNKSSA